MISTKTILRPITAILFVGMIGSCSQESRRDFFKGYNPIRDAIDSSREKSRRKRKIKAYEKQGATHEEAKKRVFEDEVWSRTPRTSTPLERHNWENPDYPDQ